MDWPLIQNTSLVGKTMAKAKAVATLRKCCRCGKTERSGSRTVEIDGLLFGVECGAIVERFKTANAIATLDDATLASIKADYKAMMRRKTVYGMFRKGMFDVAWMTDNGYGDMLS